ncbi:hypothetical protein HPB50_023683 [Hyalomma asiaticum]|uniref:Uncharacterized protein n=1 Tax=Hyalomma asiaticum TaxID=266040 RepID=A0ACB7T6H0_HYAAI|nr:hypothetical protein HPB50_023683 [Hyalomma asiaticum]
MMSKSHQRRHQRPLPHKEPPEEARRPLNLGGLSVSPGESWVLERQGVYHVLVQLYDKHHHQIDASKGLQLHVHFPAKYFGVLHSTENGTLHEVQPLRAGKTMIKAELQGCQRPDGTLLRATASGEQEVSIEEPLSVQPKAVWLPWDPEKVPVHMVRARAQGGTGAPVSWHLEAAPAWASLDAVGTVATLVTRGGPGKVQLTAHDGHFAPASMEVLLAPIVELEAVDSPVLEAELPSGELLVLLEHHSQVELQLDDGQQWTRHLDRVRPLSIPDQQNCFSSSTFTDCPELPLPLPSVTGDAADGVLAEGAPSFAGEVLPSNESSSPKASDTMRAAHTECFSPPPTPLLHRSSRKRHPVPDDQQLRPFDDCSQVSLSVDIVDKHIIKHLPGAGGLPMGRGCTSVRLQCQAAGHTRLQLSLGLLQSTVLLGCYKPLRVGGHYPVLLRYFGCRPAAELWAPLGF